MTGASTGIGRLIAETLAPDGHFVYAGARKQADLDALDAIPNIKAVRLDVTEQDEIDAAVELVRAGGRDGVVWCAGQLGQSRELQFENWQQGSRQGCQHGLCATGFAVC